MLEKNVRNFENVHKEDFRKYFSLTWVAALSLTGTQNERSYFP